MTTMMSTDFCEATTHCWPFRKKLQIGFTLDVESYVIQKTVHPFVDAHSSDRIVEDVNLSADTRVSESVCMESHRERKGKTYGWFEPLIGQKFGKRNDLFCCVH